jgi:site-specific recombinase XerD
VCNAHPAQGPLHGLRHIGATWLTDAGVPLHVLQEILGNASIETTRGYLDPRSAPRVRRRTGQRFPQQVVSWGREVQGLAALTGAWL